MYLSIPETLYVRVMLRNPLKIALVLANLTLDWRFQAAGEDEYNHNSKVQSVYCRILYYVVLF